jgi:hypothetical protein
MRGKTLKIVVLVLVTLSFLVIVPLAMAKKMTVEECKKGCEKGIDYCVKACEEGAGNGSNPNAKGQCAKTCKKALEKCSEICEQRGGQ